ncbi:MULTISPECIES: diguanylate cyclase [unclassified Wenzhouxiangella]|uniref:diguanylate cyclase n=1 Tax=unclassified Wenzhouxiangella TaxID=2613841 RepID=UPI0015F286A8|nr:MULTISPECIES: diguanylate cyclase [unclassified Wenzhouxiangella]
MQVTPQLLEQALELSHDAVTIFEIRNGGSAAGIIYVNRAFETMSGYERDEVLGCAPGVLRGEKTDAGDLESFSAALDAGASCEGESWYYRKCGKPFLMSWEASPVLDDAGNVSHFVVVQQDVTERRRRRRRRQDLERMVDLQREVVSGGLDLQRVRQRIVEAAREITGADAAVVEETEGEEMVYRAVAGIAGEALGMRLPIDASLSGLCFRSCEILRTDDTRDDPRVDTEAALKVGFVSGILVPLVHDGHCYGVLKVYASRPDAFSSDERQLLEIASGILASALFTAASFESEVNRRSMLIDAIPILVSYIDLDRRYQEVNAAYEDWFGVEASDIRGKFMWEVVGEAAYETIRPHLDAALSGEEVSYEADIPYQKGGKRTVLAQYQPNLDSSGKVEGVYAVVRDLTSVKQAEQDFLTGLWNRRKFEEKSEDLLRKASRYRQPVSLVLIDIDHFKAINDCYGHLVGDEVLKVLGWHLGNTVRGVDVVGRWGGEEFIILAPETAAEEACQLAERICSEIRRLSFEDVDHVTASFGVAQWMENEEWSQLMERADGALYKAKRDGRDRVMVAQGSVGPANDC